jgi:hypothetical protein
MDVFFSVKFSSVVLKTLVIYESALIFNEKREKIMKRVITYLKATSPE